MKKIVCILLMLGSSLKVMAAQATEKDGGNYDDLIAMHLEDEKPLAKKFKNLHEQDSRIPQLADIAQYNINYYGDENINWQKLIDHAQQVALDPQEYIDQNSENNHDNSVYVYVDESEEDGSNNDEEEYEYDQEDDDQQQEEKEVDPRQEAIDLALKYHSYLRNGFYLLRETLGSFRSFLEQHLAYDDEDGNYGEVIVQAKDLLYKTLATKIVGYVNSDVVNAFLPNINITDVTDYIMNHKDMNELEHRELLEELFKGITAQSSVYEVLDEIKNPILKKLLIYIQMLRQGVEFLERKLYKAAENGHRDIVELLLTYPGIDVNKGSLSPLYKAAENGDREIVTLLLAHPGIDVNQWGPLFKAARNGDRDIVELLVAHPGIDVNRGDITPLCIAAENGHRDIVELLVAQPGIDVNQGSITPLYRAAKNGHRDIVELLVAQPGIDINKKYHSFDGFTTPLGIAIEKNKKEIAQLLRNAGAHK